MEESPEDHQNHKSKQTEHRDQHRSPEHKRKPISRYYSCQGLYRPVAACITIILLLFLIIVLILWLVYRPHKPQFTVIAAAIYDLNTSSLPLFSTTMQFTILMRNPSSRASIYYDKLSAYVSYRNQAITPPLMLPPLLHAEHSTVGMSPVMGGVMVPVSTEVANSLVADEAVGVMALRVVVLGRLRWKTGIIRTGRYRVYVRCDVLMGMRRGYVGQVPLLGSPGCKVDL